MINYDEFGPEKLIEFYDPKSKVRGFLVIDNTTRGVGKGGMRIANVTMEEVFRLARAMTYKNTMADLPFGGAKSGLIIPNNIDKEAAVRWFSEQLRIVIPKYYVAGPDMNSGAIEMDIIAKILSNKASTGKSISLGGLPHELGSTGYGIAHSLLATLKHLEHNINETTVAIEGFGNVGTFTSKFLSDDGAKIVAISDSKGTIYDRDGLDIEKLIKVKNETGSVINYQSSTSKKLTTAELFGLQVDVLMPGARPDSINDKNYTQIKAHIIIEAGNVPMTESLEESFYKKGVVVIPDFVANAGGVISSWVEYENDKTPTPKTVIDLMMREVKTRVGNNTKLVLDRADKNNISTREAAMNIVRERLVLE
ncbi:MAG: Glu/Leu/Phe/Val dehydrogenase [Candidatus Aenigmarchaeota archaeon]|nr:Glu/Leu/Phe/Val dehydrogenase [Candidatus Aenigmarchaeota archaeon]